MPLKQAPSNEQALRPIVMAQSDAEAKAYFKCAVLERMKADQNGYYMAEAEIRQSLTYYCGFFSEERQARVLRLFGSKALSE